MNANDRLARLIDVVPNMTVKTAMSLVYLPLSATLLDVTETVPNNYTLATVKMIHDALTVPDDFQIARDIVAQDMGYIDAIKKFRFVTNSSLVRSKEMIDYTMGKITKSQIREQ